MTQSDQTDIDREIELDYTLERLADIREIIGDLLEGIELGRFVHVPAGGLSSLESVATACYAAERRWAR